MITQIQWYPFHFSNIVGLILFRVIFWFLTLGRLGDQKSITLGKTYAPLPNQSITPHDSDGGISRILLVSNLMGYFYSLFDRKRIPMSGALIVCVTGHFSELVLVISDELRVLALVYF